MQQFSGWTKDRIDKLKAEGKIQNFRLPVKSFQEPGKNKQVFKARSKAKDWLNWNLPYWCNENAVSLELEFQFHPHRKWKFDWAIPSLKIAVEYEGIFSAKSRHTTMHGYNADTDKYNAAAAMGWRVIRLTAKNYTNVLRLLNGMV
jgi:hypothetical protein